MSNLVENASLHVILMELSKFKSSICLMEIKDLDITCKSTIGQFLKGQPSILKIQAVLDYTYERINIGNWKEVKPYLRKTMTIASYLKLLVHIQNNVSSNVTEALLKDFFYIIDHGLLFGCPLKKEPQLLQKCASFIQNSFGHLLSLINVNNNKTLSNIYSTKASDFSASELEVHDCPSMEFFYKKVILENKPVILKNCINHWPALTKWKDPNYLIQLAGLRTVPVELGSKYTDTEWTQKLMTLGDFIKDNILNSSSTTGYLAQYQLFEQIPELKSDISEPEYCCFSEIQEPSVDTNAWFGPKGTLSPLHHDPKKNLLAQVVGSKQLFLFSPLDSEYLYPHEDELLCNTAKVDPRCPDLNLYPKYKNAKPLFCHLHPGDVLYIPPKWWHFVESLSISFSVSFWWE